MLFLSFMARLLTNRDYLRLVQLNDLNQIIENNQQVLLDTEQSAQVESIGYLIQRYRTNEVFTDTTIFSFSAVYNAKSLVYLDASAYSAALTYTLNILTLNSGNVYYCSTIISVPEVFNLAHWTLLGTQYSFFNVTLPAADFNSHASYIIGNKVWYKNSVYTCQIACSNILPTNSAFWGTGALYTVSAIWPTDQTKWSAGDNRNPFFVTQLINIVLYWLHHRINPKLVPDHRKEAYDGNSPSQVGGAIGWLKNVGSGAITADLPDLQPEQGLSVRWGNANGVNSDGTVSISKNIYW